MLEHLKECNPDYCIKSVHDVAFQTYGKIVDEDVQDAIEYVKTSVRPPKTGNSYQPSVSQLEQLESIQKLSQKVYGGLEVIAGSVVGDNHVFNGIEYHQCSEVIVAVTDFILVVGHLWDMEDNTYDSSKCELFYVPKGTVVECYSTTLHYTPICVRDEGFKTICLLLKGTGDAVERDGILKKKNKWFVAHVDNLEKIQTGDYPGLTGKMIKINY